MHEFNLHVKDNKLKAVVRTSSMFRTRTEENAKAYKRKDKHAKPIKNLKQIDFD